MSVFAVGAVNAFGQWSPTTPDGTVTGPIYYNQGRVGIGTATPGTQFNARLHVFGASATTQFIQEENTDPAGTGGFLARGNLNFNSEFGVRGSNRGAYGALVANDGYMYANGSFTFMADAGGVLKFAAGGNTERLRIAANGNIGIGTTNPGALLDVNGSINVSGNINAKYQDIAEWVPSSGDLPPGTVVVISDDSTNTVVPSSRPYDTRVAGVVSTQPGMILGVASDTKSKIATTGRVKVRVDATTHPVALGDLLVTSDRPGVAMVSEPLDLGGTKIHRPGTLIGKALEPLPKGEGEILVLLSLQ
ncbi:MAG TPA: hypothetical protein VNN08_13535, partial [Thermoanaerobaculia bacterium]|nr:hypothetical protein [Thermoanaerobaculia bacterium]